ncbi:MAG: DNA-directed RNA polymerase subunit omega [Flavobacteriales bacterium]|nr:DNA-directed RNA polymerase subunit omega [Flavobacteriales bacterium]
MSNFKTSNAAKTTITRNTNDLDAKLEGNLFETVVLLTKRANQISREMKEELNQKLEEFTSHQDNLEEIFENREQIEISKFYERLPKPNAVAIQELIEDKIYYRYPEEPQSN